MRKHCFVAAFAVILTFMLTFSVDAQTYTDHCASASDDTVKTYAGFLHRIPDFAVYSGWQSCQDATVLCMGGQTASAVYRISGANTLRADIYAENSTVASAFSADAFRLGVGTDGSLSGLLRCFYDGGQDTIFLKSMDEIYTMRLTRSGYIFKKDSVADAASRFYGLDIEASPNGVSYAPVSNVQLAQIESQMLSEGSGAYYHERYVAGLPGGTTHVRLTMRACRNVRGENMPDAILPENTLMLARVVFEGIRLQTGIPENDPDLETKPQLPPLQQQQEPSSSSLSSGKSAKKKSSGHYGVPMGAGSLQIDTYNGIGSYRETVRAGAEPEITGPLYTAADHSYRETGGYYDPPVVHTDLAGRVKPEETPGNASVAVAFAGMAALAFLVMLAVL